jgi:uncharacterized protein YcbX
LRLSDREWLIVLPDGTFQSARQHPQLITTTLSYSDKRQSIVVEKPGSVEKLYLPLDETKLPAVSESIPAEFQDYPEPKVMTVRVWRWHCEAEDLGEDAAKFFSDFINHSVRLVRSSSRVAPRLISDCRADLVLSTDDQVSCMFLNNKI